VTAPSSPRSSGRGCAICSSPGRSREHRDRRPPTGLTLDGQVPASGAATSTQEPLAARGRITVGNAYVVSRAPHGRRCARCRTHAVGGCEVPPDAHHRAGAARSHTSCARDPARRRPPREAARHTPLRRRAVAKSSRPGVPRDPATADRPAQNRRNRALSLPGTVAPRCAGIRGHSSVRVVDTSPILGVAEQARRPGSVTAHRPTRPATVRCLQRRSRHEARLRGRPSR
jgi:hypothetical protein